jgi:hypothetical protein
MKHQKSQQGFKYTNMTREQLSQEYYNLAAQAGDLALSIRNYRQRLADIQDKMTAILSRSKYLPALPNDPAATAPTTPTDGTTEPAKEETPEASLATETTQTPETTQP